MTELEPSAKAWMDAVQVEVPFMNRLSVATVALQRALLEIEVKKHELRDFKQKVSDAIDKEWENLHYGAKNNFSIFIIDKPHPDPLVDVLEGVKFDHYPPNDAKTIRAALDALGFEITEKKND